MAVHEVRWSGSHKRREKDEEIWKVPAVCFGGDFDCISADVYLRVGRRLLN